MNRAHYHRWRTGAGKLRVYGLALALLAGGGWQAWQIVQGGGGPAAGEFAAHEFWEAAEPLTADSTFSTAVQGRTASVWRLNRATWQEALRKAPHEQVTELGKSESLISLPLPDGSFARFRIVESPTLEPALAARYPEIKSYRGAGVDDPSMLVRFDWSPRGLHALALTKTDAVSIAPLRHDDLTRYSSRYGQAMVQPQEAACLAEQLPDLREATAQATLARAAAPEAFAFGSVRRNFRIAIATTVEYTNAPNLGGGSVPSALASVNSWLNAVNVLYERDLSIHFNLAANNDQLIFAANDSFTNGNANALLTEVRSVLAQTLGAANYDLGHVLGTGSGGTANLGVVCVDSGSPGPFKGGGVTLFSPTATVGHPYFLTRLAHELAHQFGATHSFNDNDVNSACGPQRNSISAWEPGSGVTIMSFAGSCNPVATGRGLFFHGGTLAQIAAFLQTNALCAKTVNTGNSAPAVNGGADFNVPRNTPFVLTAVATDADVYDTPNLSYAWEQVDMGSANYSNPPFTDAGDGPGSTRPLFRSYAPTNSRTRIFPSLEYILNNANEPPLMRNENGFELFSGESLPKVGRTLTFKVTGRDGRGGVADDDVVINVDGNAGPFAVTAPNAEVSWPIGSQQTITWSVNNTNGATINAAQVRLTLSTDGGGTFPVTLLTATPNDGSETITVPGGLTTTTARVRVEAIGNIFFDISDADFEITPGAAACPTIAEINPVRAQAGVAVTLTGTNLAGVSAVRFNNNINAAFTILSNTQIRAVVPAGATTGPIRLLRSDCAEAQSAAFTVAACNFTLNATVRNVVAAASNNNVAVTANAGCAWTAKSPVEWIRVTSGATGTASGTVNFAISANTGPARTAVLTVAGQALTVNQAAGCVFRLNRNSQNFGGAGATAEIPVATEAGCAWTAVSNVPWVKLVSGGTYQGPGAVQLTVAPNAGLERAGTLTIAGQNFNVTQDSNCGYAITPASRSFAATAGTGVINVSAGSNCTWVAQSHVNWITIVAGANSVGNNNVTFNVAANPGPARTGELTVAGRGFTVTQAGGCSFALNRTGQDFGANGGTGAAINVTAGAGCAWTASSPVDWVRITSGASGTGNGTINLTVAANGGPARSALLTLAQRPYTISQAGNCAVTLNAATRTFTAPAATSTLNVTAAASCAWMAISNVNWLTITSGASGTGNGIVGYSVAINPGGARVGTLTIGGVTHTVTQNAAACTYTLSPGTQQVNGPGGSGSVQVTTASHCTWTATSGAGWLALEGMTAGLGSGMVTFLAAPNPGPARSGALTIGGQTFTANQESGCQFQLSATQLRAAAAGESLSLTIGSLTGCQWTAVSNADWIKLNNGAQGSGTGTVRFEVGPNTGVARTGTLTVAGQALTLSQAADVTSPDLVLASLNPPYANAGGGEFELTVTGLNFSHNAVVQWNGSDRPTNFVNATQLKAQISAADIASDGLARLTVFEPFTNSASNVASFLIAGAGANVSAASFTAQSFAPEQMVALFGQRLATATLVANAVPLPTTLAGTRVRIKDSAGVERLAPLFFVSAGQINYLIPAATASGPATVTVTGSDNRVTLTTIQISAVAPGFFSADATGRGLPAGVVLRVTGTQQRFEALSRFDTATRSYVAVPIDLGPATDQVYLVLYGTGWRQRSNLNAVTCALGGVNVPAAFAGAQGGLVGLDQVNVLVPRNLAGRGEVEVVLTVDGQQTNPVKVQIK
jgi:uncharacterized protein (TIGR03437 family)